MNPKTLIEIITDHIKNNELPQAETFLASPDFPPNSRLNRCFYKITATGSSTKTRCMRCGIPDDENTDCLHLPFDHAKSPHKTPLPEFLSSLFQTNPHHLTPIIATDGRSGELPEYILNIKCDKTSLKQTIRKIFYTLLLQSFNPPPLIVLSAGSYDFGSDGEVRHGDKMNLEQNYLENLEHLENFVNSMGGKLMVATLIPRLADQDVREGNLLTKSERRHLKDSFWIINDKLTEKNKTYGKEFFMDLTKYFTKRPDRKRRRKEIEMGYESRPVKFIKKSFKPDGITPSDDVNAKVNYTLISTAVAKCGLGSINKVIFRELSSGGGETLNTNKNDREF